MVSRKTIAAIVVLLLCCGTWCWADEFKFQQGKDHGWGVYDGGHDLTIASTGTWPGANPHRLRMYYYSDEIYNSLIRFDKLDETITGNTVVYASIKLTFQTDVLEWIPATIDIYPLLKPWHDPNCNWDFANYGVGLAWEDNGAQDPNDRGPLDKSIYMEDRSWNPRIQYEGEYEFPLNPETVQKWIDDPNTNYGVIMVMNPDAATDVTFSSNDDSEITARPYLTINICREAIPADINHDCYVDFIDFNILQNQWLQETGILSADIAPAGGDNIVDMADFALMANNWLKCSKPGDINCD